MEDMALLKFFIHDDLHATTAPLFQMMQWTQNIGETEFIGL